jgi:hypothetical protein
VSVTARPNQMVPEQVLDAVRYMTRRLVHVAEMVAAGRAVLAEPVEADPQ